MSVIKNKQIGIIGLGVLGGTYRRWLQKVGKTQPLCFDIDKNKDPNSTINNLVKKSDLIFLCLPTNGKDDYSLDTSILENTLDNIELVLKSEDKKHTKKVIIRSTVPVGFTRKMQKRHINFRLYFMPEFLTESIAEFDFANPDISIVGVDNYNTISASDKWMEWNGLIRIRGLNKFFGDYYILPIANNEFVCSYEEAELLKLSTNSFYAMKVTFANELNNYCNKAKIDYKRIMELLALNPRIGSENNDTQSKTVHLRVSQDGRAGYGGACLPKDVRQLINLMKDKKSSYGLLEKVDEINNKIRI